MAKLKIQNVGPVREGLSENGGYLDLPQGITLLIGEQGSGKSTIAKIYSTLCWLEKSQLLKHTANLESRETDPLDLKAFLKYQGIESYLQKKSYIDYRGECYSILYSEGSLNFRK